MDVARSSPDSPPPHLPAPRHLTPTEATRTHVSGLAWLTIDTDLSGSDDRLIGQIIEAAKGAANILSELGCATRPLRVSIVAAGQVHDGASAVITNDSGVSHLTLARTASALSVAHELGHVIIAQASSFSTYTGIKRASAILAQEYLAQWIGVRLLDAMRVDAHTARAQEVRAQRRAIAADYRVARTTFQTLVNQGSAPAELSRHTLAFMRTCAYLLGAGGDVAGVNHLPKAIRCLIDDELARALATIDSLGDLTDAVARLDRAGLDPIVGGLLSEVASNALIATPRHRRHPDWPAAFGPARI